MQSDELRAALRVIDGQLADVDRRLQDFNSLMEQRTKLLAAKHSLLSLLPNGKPKTGEGAPPEQVEFEGVRPPRGRRTARHAMLDLLKRTGRPADHEALLRAVAGEDLLTESFRKNPVQAVYQTMYAARKEGLPVARLHTGEWVWRGGD